MQIVVFSRVYKPQDLPHIQHLFDVLNDLNFSTYVFTPYLEQIIPFVHFAKPVGKFDSHLDFKIRDIDFVLSLGGDGTILQATALVRNSGVPILGINLGRLGFLATVNRNEIRESLFTIIKGDYRIDQRKLLAMDSEPALFGAENFALNDCTLLKRDTSSMIIIHTFINGEFLNSYWSDGIIIATPTGSTAYSLSCGGPIVFPDSNNFVITPVAPHNLNLRPIIISDESILTFEIEGRADNFLCTMDSRQELITSEHQIAVRKADFTVGLIQLESKDFLNTLRKKLTWGVDTRN